MGTIGIETRPKKRSSKRKASATRTKSNAKRATDPSTSVGAIERTDRVICKTKARAYASGAERDEMQQSTRKDCERATK